MKISLNVIRKYLNYELPDLDVIVQNIGEQLGAVEEVVEIGARYDGAVIVRVVACVKHDNSDHLNICRIDDGGVTQNVERGEDGLVQVVCGAPNVYNEMLAVWLPPGSTVPSSHDSEPFVLGARELRGVQSNGMLASAKELALGDDHTGILEIETDKNPGQLFADAYGLTGDVVIDIENKMFTHRPDCFGVLGVAREIAGIQDKQFASPDWYTAEPEFPMVNASLPISFSNTIPQLVPRFSLATMANVTVTDSPVWLRVELARYGQKSINSIVDLTNYYMLLTGQPLHAYDYDKVKTLNNNQDPHLMVRHPEQGETIALLNGKTVEPRSEAILVTTTTAAIAIGGVMGGSETEVDHQTKNIIIECANFDMYNIRRTSMAHGLFTDAVTRFNKGQSPYQTAAVLTKIVADISERNWGVVAQSILDDNHAIDEHTQVNVTTPFINERLGLSLQTDEIVQILSHVEIVVEQDGDTLRITAPFWRTDISIPEDIVEEVGRLYGFDKLARDLPSRTVTPVKTNELLALKSQLRHALAGFGANELLTYSFVHGNMLESAQQTKDLAFKINNALSPDLQYYRLSITPSLLNNVHSNVKAGYDTFALFEIGKTHNKLHADDNNDVPKEYEMVALVFASNVQSAQPAYYQAQNYATQLSATLGIEVEYKPFDSEVDYPVANPFDLNRSAIVYAPATDTFLGIVGEYKASVRKKFKLPAGSAGFELGLSELMVASSQSSSYTPLSRFPHVSQDICLQVDEKLTYQNLTSMFNFQVKALISENESINTRPIDIYAASELDGQKRVTYRVTLTSYERTLNDEILSKILNGAAQTLLESIGAQRI